MAKSPKVENSWGKLVTVASRCQRPARMRSWLTKVLSFSETCPLPPEAGMPLEEVPGLLPPEEAGLPLPPEAGFPFHVVRCCASIFDLQYCVWQNLSSFLNGVARYRHEPWILRTSPLCF